MHKLASLFGKAALVVKEAKYDEQSDCQVKIVARHAGLFAFIASIFGIDSTFTMRVFRDRIESEEGSLSGVRLTTVPLAAIDTYSSGYFKPAASFVIGLVLSLFGIYMFATAYVAATRVIGVALIGIGAVYFIDYALKKSVLLEFSTIGANGIFFLFKRSVIEGVNVDERFAKAVADLVKRNYLEQVVK